MAENALGRWYGSQWLSTLRQIHIRRHELQYEMCGAIQMEDCGVADLLVCLLPQSGTGFFCSVDHEAKGVHESAVALGWAVRSTV